MALNLLYTRIKSLQTKKLLIKNLDGFQRLAEMVRGQHPSVDKFIGDMKRVFIKCARRRREFVEKTGLALPPTAKTRHNVKSFILALDDDAPVVLNAQEIFESEAIPLEIAFIATNFRQLSTAIKSLKGQFFPR